MSEKDETEDLSAWGDALAEQADAEEPSDDSAEADPWGDALSEQADAEAQADVEPDNISSAAFDQLAAERGDGKNKVDLEELVLEFCKSYKKIGCLIAMYRS